MQRWMGLKDLVQDAVEHGSRAVERVHKEVARTPLLILQRVPPLAGTARHVLSIQDGIISSAYAAVRLANCLAGALVGAALHAADGARRVSGSDGA